MPAPVPCSPAAADLPPDDLLREAFLRLPPEPRHLRAASLVCRRWRRLVRDPAFLRSFRAFHRTPPVLGFFENLCSIQPRIGSYTCFVPTAGVSGLVLPDPERMREVLDCRHGRVLFHSHGERGLLVVWDPMACDTRYVSSPPWSKGGDATAAVVCADGHHDHTDCHSSPFHIVFVESTNVDYHDCLVSACVYDSEAGIWGGVTTIASPSAISSDDASVFVGNSLYWLLDFAGEGRASHILQFDLYSQRLALIELPEGVRDDYNDIHLMPAEDGSIGFVHIKESTIHFWTRRHHYREVAAEWALLRMVDLRKFTSPGLAARDMLRTTVVGFSEDSDVLFVQSGAYVFTMSIRSMQLREVPYASGSTIYPYSRFYTPGCDIVGLDDSTEQ
ncbi:hypothetical protein ACP70R_020688 [Stipagrostis hirtigluma subsp. patula]